MEIKCTDLPPPLQLSSYCYHHHQTKGREGQTETQIQYTNTNTINKYKYKLRVSRVVCAGAGASWRGTNRKVFKVKWSEADAQTIIFAEHKYEIYKHKYKIYKHKYEMKIQM